MFYRRPFLLILIAVILVGGLTVIGVKIFIGHKQVKDINQDFWVWQVKDNHISSQILDKHRQQFEEIMNDLKSNPDKLNSWIDLGVLKKAVGDFEGARLAWEQAGIIRPANSLSFFNLGDLYWNFIKNNEKAEMNYLVALKNDPQWVDVYLNLSDFYREIGQGEKTEAILNEGLKQLPDNPSLLAYLGAYFRDKKDNQQALKYFEQLKKLKPDDVSIQQEIKRLQQE